MSALTTAKSKKLIVEKLEAFGVPFIDVGMGVRVSDDVLAGTVRVTTSTPDKRDHFRNRVSFEELGNNEYNRNIQVADLNALNAALAVIKWKKLFGFYLDLKSEYHSQFHTATNIFSTKTAINEETGRNETAGHLSTNSSSSSPRNYRKGRSTSRSALPLWRTFAPAAAGQGGHAAEAHGLEAHVRREDNFA